MNFFDKVLKHLKKPRGVGFWLLLAAAVLAIVVAFVYLGTFIDGEDRYWSVIAFLLPLFALVAFGMCFYKHTARYAGLVMFVLLLIGLLVTVETIYYYIADAVFKASSGVSAGENVNVIAAVGGGVTCLFIFYIIDILLCAVASFFAQFKEADEPETAENTVAANNTESAEPATANANKVETVDDADNTESTEEVAP